jgi:alpha-beta hydrolase superfamily lysophospholipase
VFADWPCPGPEGPASEQALAFDRDRAHRLLIVPALFEEANRTRRFLVETMRRLDAAGIDSFLPDLPGCNESPQDFAAQSLHAWRTAMMAQARAFRRTHVLAVRGGALVFPDLAAGLGAGAGQGRHGPAPDDPRPHARRARGRA